MRCKSIHFFFVFIILWIWLMIKFMWSSKTSSQLDNSPEFSEDLLKQLEEAQKQIERLTDDNIRLTNIVKDYQIKEGGDSFHPVKDKLKESHDSSSSSETLDGPSTAYENTRRRIKHDVREMWNFINVKLKFFEHRLKSQNEELSSKLKETREVFFSFYNAVLIDMDTLAEVDGHAAWRLQESKNLSLHVQSRLTALQNPSDCKNARKLLCNLNKGCGYGCQIHHVVYCFVSAIGAGRALVLKSKGWRYNRAGFENVFKPLSETCQRIPEVLQGELPLSRSSWPGKEDTVNVDIPIVDSVNPRPKHLPPSIPKEIASRIIRLHGDPIVWWISEVLRYILRPQEDLQVLLNSTEEDKLPRDKSPYVGIHVRRTDKVGTEAAFHPVEEYMEYVEERFKYLDASLGSNVERRVYVASDDPRVLVECRKKFPHYSFYGDATVARSAAVSSRYSSDSLKGVITDIHLLSKADYLVCTFSSQVCRIAYEILQNRFPDGHDRFKSLDDIWYFGGQDEHQQEVIIYHGPKTRDEIELKVGDVIGVAGNHWDGFNKGKNLRNRRVGLYPEYKTKEKFRIVEFRGLRGSEQS
uniref:Alpha-(1,6)-fucosyltransferase n=1 Tax=Lepeophtheirus salmonis TaxID=72036 RepID=A0A0A1TTM2_LEPSM|nr:TPA_inf: alpha1,6 fucosyltransferase [Lepeophtheirus salmonis]